MCSTHDYDGKIDLKELDILTECREKKQEKCRNFIDNNNFTPLAKFYLSRIIEDMDNHSNYDPTNNLHAGDLLYTLTFLESSKDLIICLNEQAEGMQTGFCAQGRTHRLIQILKAFKSP